jgi:hypothetical protein
MGLFKECLAIFGHAFFKKPYRPGGGFTSLAMPKSEYW